MSIKRIICSDALKIFCRQYSARSRVQFEENVVKDIENAIYKPRKHPGIARIPSCSVPENIVKAMYNSLQDFPVKSLVADSDNLVTFLKNRHKPLEQHELKSKVEDIEKKILSEYGKENLTENEKIALFSKYRGQMLKALKTKVHLWRSVEYTTYSSLLYMVGRSAAEYAVLMRIMTELSTKHPGYKPRSVFDFGSGVGTGTWAFKSIWGTHLFEYFCVDSSSEMNDLADVILKDGVGNKNSTVKGVFRRQFLPASSSLYNIVLSSYSLSELPSMKSRLETVLNLWNKTQDYLIIVELGNNIGFKIVSEVRDFILDIKDENNCGHVVMPCPHDQICPRLATDNTPCNFEINYHPLPFGNKHGIHTERFSYVVIKKGKRSIDDSQWPRLVRPTLVKSKHAICRMCTSAGKLEEVIFTASKHGKIQHHCARSSRWGDTLPVKLHSNEAKSNM